MSFSRCGSLLAAVGGVPGFELIIYRIEKENKIERKAEEVRRAGEKRQQYTARHYK